MTIWLERLQMPTFTEQYDTDTRRSAAAEPATDVTPEARLLLAGLHTAQPPPGD